MKTHFASLSREYLRALETYLQPGARANLELARKIGGRAVALELETLDLARMHEQSLVSLMVSVHSSRAKISMIRRAGIFFREANAQIEETHMAARRVSNRLSQVLAKLEKRMNELSASNLELKKGAARRKNMEDTLKKSGRHHEKRLKESLDLQNHLRQLTHRVLAAQEDERKKISRELQDEIAQTLLGINVRLLSLKQEAKVNTTGLHSGIAIAQRMVEKSAMSVRQVGRKIGGL